MNTALKIWQNIVLSLLVILLLLFVSGYSFDRAESYDKYQFQAVSGAVPQAFLYDTETGEIWWYKNFQPEQAAWTKYAPPLVK